MKFVITLLLLCSVAQASELEELKKQLDSIENGQKARRALLEGVKNIRKWADGVNTEEARKHIDKTSETMALYWGTETANLLRKRLNGMVYSVNGESKWIGTKEKFIKLKKELITFKKKQIKDLEKPVVVDRPPVVIEDKIKDYKELITIVKKMDTLKQKTLLGHDPRMAYIDKEINGAIWTMPLKVTGVKRYSNKKVIWVIGKLNDPRFDIDIQYSVDMSELPKNLKIGDVIKTKGRFKCRSYTIRKEKRTIKRKNTTKICGKIVLYSKGSKNEPR